MTLKITQTGRRLTVRATGADAKRLLSELSVRGLGEGLESLVLGLNAVPKRPISLRQASSAGVASGASCVLPQGAA